MVEFNTKTNELNETNSLKHVQIHGLGWDASGKARYDAVTYEKVVADGLVLQENFANGHITDYSFSKNGQVIIKVDTFNKEYTGIDQALFSTASIELNAPAPMDISATTYYVPFVYTFTSENGKIVRTAAEIVSDHANETRFGSDLFILANGMLNENTKMDGAPEYLVNLKSDIIDSGKGAITSADVALAPDFERPSIYKFISSVTGIQATENAVNVFQTLFGAARDASMEKAVLLTTDVLAWLLEASDPSKRSFLADQIKASLGDFFGRIGQTNRQRNTVGVGYSGGFVPLTEVVTKDPYNATLQTGYNVKTLVALGAALVKPTQAFNDILVKILEAADLLTKPEAALELVKDTLLNLDQLLSANGLIQLGSTAINRIADFFSQKATAAATAEFENSVAKVQDSLSTVFKGFVLDDLTAKNTNMIVNVYGTKDLLVDKIKINGNAIGGYRDNIGGFSAANANNTLVNIEIVGASHFDYMRRDTSFLDALINVVRPSDKEWNQIVSQFVSDLIANSQNNSVFGTFLAAKRNEGIATFENDRWIIRLNGFSSRA